MSQGSINHQTFLACSNKLVTKHQFSEVWSPARRGQEKLSPIADCWGLINHPGDPSKKIISKLQRKAKERLHIPANLTVRGGGGEGTSSAYERRKQGICFLVPLRNQQKLWNMVCLQYEEDAHKLQFSLMSVSLGYNTTLDIQKLILQFPCSRNSPV